MIEKWYIKSSLTKVIKILVEEELKFDMYWYKGMTGHVFYFPTSRCFNHRKDAIEHSIKILLHNKKELEKKIDNCDIKINILRIKG